jgi:hypothetical protein
VEKVTEKVKQAKMNFFATTLLRGMRTGAGNGLAWFRRVRYPDVA